MSFSLGSIDPLNVAGWEGFDYPETVTILELLENEEDSTGNAVLQQSALPFLQATISGTITSSGDVDDLRDMAAEKTTETFVDDESTSHAVVVLDLRIRRIFPSVWAYSCRLVEVA